MTLSLSKWNHYFSRIPLDMTKLREYALARFELAAHKKAEAFLNFGAGPKETGDRWNAYLASCEEFAAASRELEAVIVAEARVVPEVPPPSDRER